MTTETVTTETTPAAVELPAVDSLAAFDDQQQALEGEYRDLVLRAASGQPFVSADVHRLTTGTGRSLANFRKDVEQGQRRLAAAKKLEQHDVHAANEAERQANAALEAEFAECQAELQALQQKHHQRLQPLRKAVEAARKASLESARVRQSAFHTLLTTRSAEIDQAIESANRAATEHQKSVDGASEVLFRLRRKLKRLEAANINDASRQREVDQLKQMIDRAQADLDEANQHSPAPPPPDSAWLDWTAFDLSSPDID